MPTQKSQKRIASTPTAARIGVLDGVRSYALLLVMSFHFWQLSWLQYVGAGFFSAHGLPYLPLVQNLVIAGSLQVDTLIFLSGFLLALPYAQALCDRAGHRPASLPPVRQFYLKRAARLAPSVYAAMLICLLVDRPAITNGGDFAVDLFSHLSFMNLYFTQGFSGTVFPGVLWTLTVEVTFYLVFPLLGRAFARWPLPAWLVMTAGGAAYTALVALPRVAAGDTGYTNQTLSFLPVYANALLAALIYEKVRRRTSAHPRRRTALATLAALGALAGLACLLGVAYKADPTPLFQLRYRGLQSTLCAVLVVGLCFAARGLQAVYDNRFTKWFALISLNAYIWHQTAGRWLLEARIPPYPAAPAGAPTPWPQSGAGDWHAAWQWGYIAACWIAALATGAAATFLIERPAARWIRKRFLKDTGQLPPARP